MGDSEFVPFDERPSFQDLIQVPQDDGPNPLVPISYPPEYLTAMNYFRAIAQKNEKSERALELTSFIIDQNPAHYTIWHYRLMVLEHLKKDFRSELEFIDAVATEHPKSYQIWHHRQLVIERLNDASEEIAFVDKMLRIDSKNYHAWSYRQWVVSAFSLWDGEIPDLDRLLDEDVRNNSAWNQRFFVLSRRPGGLGGDKGLAEEIEFVLKKIKLAPNNESPWNYLRGIVELAGKTLADFPNVEAVCTSLGNDTNRSFPQALLFLLDLNQQKIKTGSAELAAAECRRLCAMLEEQDPVRKLYWRYRSSLLTA
ncbi:hypothetical protein HK104_008278 [Borealophlyctis nickersoniae]|nr:hypothetical protein HK104_008278 [Borealophlyctis nickersoniae]